VRRGLLVLAIAPALALGCEQVTSLPKWLLLWPDGSGGIGSTMALGPAPPTCAPG